MPGFWAFFQEYGTGGLASAGWIRHGTLEGSAFAWDGDQIPFPDLVWAYIPDGSFTGYLAVDPSDPNFLWVAATVQEGDDLFSRCYVYDIDEDTWTNVLDVAFIGDSTPFCVDMAFDPDGTTFMAIGGNGALGRPGAVGEGGVYKSVDRGAFSFAGSGHENAYRSGNINDVKSLTALDLIPDTGDGRVLYTAHTLTRVNIFQTTGWVTSSSTDDGGTWDDPSLEYNGNQFQLECLTVMRVNVGETGFWYCADHSGTGAYSTANLTAVMGGSPGNGPTGGYGGGVFSSGAICYPFPADGSKAVGFPTQVASSDLYNSDDAGANWAGTARSSGNQGAFTYRGGRTSRDSAYAAGVSLANATHDSQIWWTDDYGETWNFDLAEEDAHGLSLDFGPSTPPPPNPIGLEVLTFYDSRNYTGFTRFYTTDSNEDDLLTNAQQLSSLFSVLSNGHFTQAVGPWTTSPVLPTTGSSTIYENIETRIRLVWATEDGIAIAVEVPCPKSELFLEDQETPSLLSEALTDAAAGGITYKLCTRGGKVATQFMGAGRVMRGLRSQLNVGILDPNETGSGL